MARNLDMYYIRKQEKDEGLNKDKKAYDEENEMEVVRDEMAGVPEDIDEDIIILKEDNGQPKSIEVTRLEREIEELERKLSELEYTGALSKGRNYLEISDGDDQFEDALADIEEGYDDYDECIKALNDNEFDVEKDEIKRLENKKQELEIKIAMLIKEQEARAKAEQEARAKAEQEAKVKAEQETKAKAEQEARAKAEQEAKVKAEQEAKAKAEQEARAKTEQEARGTEPETRLTWEESERKWEESSRACDESWKAYEAAKSFNEQQEAWEKYERACEEREKAFAEYQKSWEEHQATWEHNIFDVELQEVTEASKNDEKASAQPNIKYNVQEVWQEISRQQQQDGSTQPERANADVQMWEQRFSGWYDAVDRVPEGAKIKSDFVSEIKKYRAKEVLEHIQTENNTGER